MNTFDLSPVDEIKLFDKNGEISMKSTVYLCQSHYQARLKHDKREEAKKLKKIELHKEADYLKRKLSDRII
jgi:hypothetical protein